MWSEQSHFAAKYSELVKTRISSNHQFTGYCQSVSSSVRLETAQCRGFESAFGMCLKRTNENSHEKKYVYYTA